MLPAAIKVVASLDEVQEKAPLTEEGKSKILWRLAGDDTAAFSFLRLPDELCLVVTRTDNVVDSCALEEALTVLNAAVEGTGKELWITWIVSHPEFDQFQLQQLELDTGSVEPFFTNVRQRVMTPLPLVQA